LAENLESMDIHPLTLQDLSSTRHLQPEQLKPSSPSCYEQIYKLDQEISGENRRELINHLKQAIIFEYEGLVEGYYLLR